MITIHTLEKPMKDRKSGNMEKPGFQAAMKELQEKRLEVTEVVTDVHLGSGAVMSKHKHVFWVVYYLNGYETYIFFCFLKESVIT